MQELCFERGKNNIYGRLYLPEKEGRLPLVILSHGFGADISDTEEFARYLSGRGFAAYSFEFIGGNPASKSGGDMREMSVLTEAEDLKTVIDGLKKHERTDTDNIFLMGMSQGGFVSTYVAAERAGEIRGLIACYPAYVLQDDARKRPREVFDAPEGFEMMGRKIGRIYDEDALSFDIYELMKRCKCPALLMHGSEDALVPLAYSERAVKTMPSAELVIIEGAGHWFGGEFFAKTAELAAGFIEKNTAHKPES